jgi:hypothetical protein
MQMFAMTGAVLCLAAAGSPAYAQDDVARRQAIEVAARVPFEKAMTGAPYSAETVVEGTQTLADGNRINRKTTGRVYRDGEGRTRREEDRPDGSIGISIVDPIAGFSYALDPKSRTAWRTTIGAAGAILGKIEASAAEQRKVELEPKMRTQGPPTDEDKAKPAAVAQEKVRAAAAGGDGGAVMMRGRGYASAPETPLEHRTLEGIPVEGRRTTMVIPAGQVGNEQPLTITSEEWRSAELNVLVLTRHSDPRTGESTYRLTNIVRAEPDRSLFMVPADYTVKETGIKRMLEATPRK